MPPTTTSEGATAVARYTGREFAGRIIYSWSCEDNYFVQAHATALPDDRPVLNVMSSTDVFFSPSNSWLGNAMATGHCGAALKANKQASVVLIPGAPHTLMNLPAARHPTEGFLRDVLRRVPLAADRPTAVICHTVKGKGISFAEGDAMWHHKNSFKGNEIADMYRELEAV